MTVGSRRPQYVLWELTLACNLRCRHCLSASARPVSGELDTSEALRVCDSLIGLGVPAVALMGGEPLVREDWRLIASRLSAGGVSTSLVTNGVKFDDETARFAWGAGVKQIVVSLDGDRDAHDALRGRGSFDAALAAIVRAHTMGFPHRMVVTSVNRDNESALPAILDVLLGVGHGTVWAINLTSIRPGQRMPMQRRIDADGFLRVCRFVADARAEHRGQLDVMGAHELGYHSLTYPDVQGGAWAGCRAGLSTMGITARGGVKGCLALPDAFLEGDVRRDDLATLWARPDGFAYNRRFDVTDLGPRCTGCEYAASCRGGCVEFSASFGHGRQAPFCLHRWEKEGAP